MGNDRWRRAVRWWLATSVAMTWAAPAAADNAAVLALLEARYGQAPEALVVTWTGADIRVRASRAAEPPWDEVPFHWQAWLIGDDRYAERFVQAGLGEHVDRGWVGQEKHGWRVDHLARVVRPASVDAGRRIRDLARLLPPLLVRELAAAPGAWTSTAAGAIRWRHANGETWEIGFLPDSGRVVMIRIHPPLEAEHDPPLRLLFADEHEAFGWRVPAGVELYVGADVRRRWRLESLALPADEPERFERPADYQVVLSETPDALAARVERLAGGIYRIGKRRERQLFIGFDEFAVALGAVGGDVAWRRARWAELAPGRPVRYLVVSHDHADHVAGLDDWLLREPGLTVVAPAAVRESLLVQVRELGIDPATVTFRWVDREYQLSDGLRRLRLVAAPTPVASAQMVVFESDARVAWAPGLWVRDVRGPEVASPNMITLNALIELIAPATEQVTDTRSAVIHSTIDLRSAVERAERAGLGMERSVAPSGERRWWWED